MTRLQILTIFIIVSAFVQVGYALGLSRGMKRADEWQRLREHCEEKLDRLRCEAVVTVSPDGGLSRGTTCVREALP